MASDIWYDRKLPREVVIMCEFDRELMIECGGMDRQGKRSEVSSHERLREKRTGVSQLARLIPCKNKRERKMIVIVVFIIQKYITLYI
jgi:hypothetical protein